MIGKLLVFAFSVLPSPLFFLPIFLNSLIRILLYQTFSHPRLPSWSSNLGLFRLERYFGDVKPPF